MYLANTLILFSTLEVAIKAIADRTNPFQINFLRFFIGGIVLLAFAIFKNEYRIRWKDLPGLAVIGILNVAVSMNLLQLSLFVEGAMASVSAVLISANPIFVILFSAVIEKEKITINKICGLILGIAGIALVFMDKLQFSSSSLLSPFLGLLASVFFGLFTVLGRKVSVSVGSLRMNTWSFLIGSLVTLPFLLIFRVPVVNVDYTALPYILYISVFVTGIAYLTYFRGLTIMGAGVGSLVFFIKPPLASVFAAIFLDEKISPNLIAGTVLILAGIAVVIYWDRIRGVFRKNRKDFNEAL